MEKPIPGSVDATLPGANADDQLAEHPVVLEQLDNPAIARESTESEVSTRKRAIPKARPLVSLSPYQTRARSRLHAVDLLEDAPAASRAVPRVKEVVLAATPASTPLEPITESQLIDEFKAQSDDEGDIHEVEDELQVSPESRGASRNTPRYYPFVLTRVIITPGGPGANSPADSLSADDLQTSQSLQGAPPDAPAAADSDSDQDDDSSDAELLAYVRKLDVPAHPPPTTSQDKGNEFDHDSLEEIFPSPGTRAGAEKRRRTQAAKAAPYVPPRGTRAASMIEKERARGAQVRRR